MTNSSDQHLKLTTRTVEQLQPQEKNYRVWDSVDNGFFVRVSPKGAKTYYVYYRNDEGKAQEYKIGRHGQLTNEQARKKAKAELGRVAQGVDIQGERSKARHSRNTAKYDELGLFLEHVYGPWAKENQRSHKQTMEFMDREFKHLHGKKLSQITKWDMEKYVKSCRQRGLKPTTINRRVAAIKGVLTKATEWNHLSENPLSGLKALKTDNAKIVRYLTKQERKALMDALDRRQDEARKARANHNAWQKERGYPLSDPLDQPFTDYLKPMILLALNTGLRRGELFHLMWDHVNLSGRILTVEGATAKSGHSRHIPLNDEAFATLTAWRNQTTNNDLVFPSPRTKGKLDNINKAWRKLLDDAGIQNFRFHDLRHDFASKLVMAGVDLNTVRELLGHNDLSTTLQYAHLAPEHKAAAVSLLNKV